jgi:hypothetical protein
VHAQAEWLLKQSDDWLMIAQAQRLAWHLSAQAAKLAMLPVSQA